MQGEEYCPGKGTSGSGPRDDLRWGRVGDADPTRIEEECEVVWLRKCREWRPDEGPNGRVWT